MYENRTAGSIDFIFRYELHDREFVTGMYIFTLIMISYKNILKLRSDLSKDELVCN